MFSAFHAGNTGSNTLGTPFVFSAYLLSLSPRDRPLLFPPPTNLRMNAFDQLAISVFRENDDFVFPELIAIHLICHNVSPFSLMRFETPRNENGPAEIDRLGLVVVYGGKKTACLMSLCGESHLLSVSGIWL
jgi:hypothetical protein